MYGTISATSSSTTPARISPAFRTVIRHENRSRDRSTLITGQLQKRFSDGLEFSAAYTWSANKEVFFLGSSIASSNLNFTALDGTLENRNLRNSALHVPHTIVVSGTTNVPLGFATSLI